MKKIITILILSFCAINISNGQEKIEMKKEGGVYTIPCVVNDLRLRFIFDTGASDVSISAIEAAFMLKNGYLYESDFINSEQYILADGSIEENAVINIKELKIGNIVLTNVKACVVKNISAPLLLGQSAISQLGKWYIDSNYLYLGINNSDILSDEMTDDECYAKVYEYEKNKDIDKAYTLLYDLNQRNHKYNKDLVNFVLRNKYEAGLEYASNICLNGCIKGDTAMISIMGRNYWELEPKNNRNRFNFYSTLYNKVDKFYAYELSKAYFELHKPNIDAQEYIPYLEKAAFQTETYAKDIASDLYIGLGVLYSKNDFYSYVTNRIYNREKSLKYYKKSIDLGNVEAMYRYGHELLQTDNITDDIKQNAVYWLEKAAKQKNTDAIYTLFEAFYTGEKLSKDYDKSIEYGKLLLELSYDIYKYEANAYIGFMYYETKDYQNAFKHLSEANRNPSNYLTIYGVHVTLGDCYWFGNGTNKNYKQAYEMYLKEWNLNPNDVYVIWKLGYMNQNGIGTNEDRKKAFNFYKEGANLGDAYCQSDLAFCYYFGSDYGYPTKVDYQKAIYWSKKAIESGEYHPYIYLAWIYSKSDSPYYNLTEAVKCYEIASNNNSGIASYELGQIYETGKGHIKKNYNLAEKYYRLAVQQGYTEAEEKLSQFE